MRMIYNNNLVFLSYAISFLGAYLTTCLCEQLRAYTLTHHHQNNNNSSQLFRRGNFYFLLMGISLGGVGIWGMHFIGMAAAHILDSKNQIVNFYYNIPITIASMICAILTSALGFAILSNDRLFAKTKSEILEMFADDLRHLSIPELKRVKNLTIMKLILTKDMKYLLIGGMVTGSGVSIMHYVGMSAIVYDGTIEWNAGIVTASVLIAMIAATAAYWILFRLLSIYPHKEYLRLLSAIVMGIAVCGMHYTGMAAATFHPDPNPSTARFKNKPYLVAANDVEVPIFVITMFVLWSLTILIFADLRKNVQKFQFYIKKTTPAALQAGIRSPENSFSLLAWKPHNSTNNQSKIYPTNFSTDGQLQSSHSHSIHDIPLYETNSATEINKTVENV